MESLFARRRFSRGRVIVTVVLSLLVHASFVGLAAIWPQNSSWKVDDEITEIDTGPVLGDTVQELIAPKEEPVPTPDAQPTPPPEETPPPDETPPPTEEPDMAEPTPPPKKDKPKLNKPAGTPAPANAKHGDRPQEGVVGGVTTAEKKTGTPGAARLGPAGGWKVSSKPPYPQQARLSHIQGSGSVRISTDASGQVISAVIIQSVGSGILDNNTMSFAKANWSGPPNSSTTVPITYKLQ